MTYQSISSITPPPGQPWAFDQNIYLGQGFEQGTATTMVELSLEPT